MKKFAKATATTKLSETCIIVSHFLPIYFNVGVNTSQMDSHICLFIHLIVILHDRYLLENTAVYLWEYESENGKQGLSIII